MDSTAHAFVENAHRALHDAKLQQSLGRFKAGFPVKRRLAIDRLPEFDELRQAARAVKDHSLAHLDLYLERFTEKAEANGTHVHWCPDAEAARQAILQICRDSGARTVAKGKSMIGEEIGVNEFLEKEGFRPVETDLGEYIIQLRHEPPSHIIAPAVHLSKDQVADAFRSHHRSYPEARPLEEPEVLLAEARTVLRQEFLAAEVGITGANLLIAETGSFVLVTNEGNGDLTQTLPRVQIVIASIEKVVPTLEDATTILRVLARSATGQDMSVYTTFATGPRRPEDLDGPAELHVLLLDNGRSRMLGNEFREMLRCIRCGACINHCPIYAAVGGHAYGWVYSGPMGAVLIPNLIGIDEAGNLPNASTLCGRCEEVCPMQIPLPRMLRQLRQRQHEARKSKATYRYGLACWAFLARRPALYRLAMALGVGALGRLGPAQAQRRALPLASVRWRLDQRPRPAGAGGADLPADVVGTGRPAAMTTARESMLAAVRRALDRREPADVAAATVAARLAQPKASVIPARGQVRGETALDQFIFEAERVNATTERIPGLDEVPARVRTYLQAANLPSAVRVAPDPELAAIPWDREPLLQVTAGRAGEHDPVSVTGSFAGIAETGTLMLLSGPESPTTLNFLPDVHIALLRTERIVGSYEEAWARLRAARGAGVMPRVVNWITGPSRTADIEQTLLLGAHGPRRLHIIIAGRNDGGG